MSEYDRLKKVIPPDLALANQALSRSLLQVKRISTKNLPTIANTLVALESNSTLDLINDLDTPLPSAVSNFWANVFATGTGPGNTITVDDAIGIAGGNTVNTQMPTVIENLQTLTDAAQLVSLTANVGNALSANNGIYTQMQYCLANAYGTGPTVVPASIYWAGGTFSDLDDAFANGLIPAANSAITSINSTNSTLTGNINLAWTTMAQQIQINQDNLSAAGIDIGNVVIGDWANSNIAADQQSVSLGIGARLHSIGQDITQGGSAQFFESVANVNSVAGQAVIASMREGRNIRLFRSGGLGIDTQLSDRNPTPALIDPTLSAQYTPDQARANIIVG